MKTKLFTTLTFLISIVFTVKAQDQVQISFAHDDKLIQYYDDSLVFISSENYSPQNLGGDILREIVPKSRGGDTLYCFFDTETFGFYLFNSEHHIDLTKPLHWTSDTSFYVILHSGIYDAIFHDTDEEDNFYLLIREQLVISNNDSLFFSRNDASNIITFNAVDENNIPLDQISGTSERELNIILPDSMPYDEIYRPFFMADTIFSNSFSSIYTINTSTLFIPSNKEKIYFAIFEPLHGVSGSYVLTVEPQDYLMQNIEINLPELGNQNSIAYLAGHRHKVNDDEWATTLMGPSFDLNSEKYECKLFLTRQYLDYFKNICSFYFSDHQRNVILLTQPFFIEQDTIINSYFYASPNYVRSPDGGKMSIGKGPLAFQADFYLMDVFQQDIFSLWPLPHLTGMYNEEQNRMLKNVFYKIYDKHGQVHQEDKLSEFDFFISPEKECYFEINYNDYKVAERNAKSSQVYYIDFENEESYPPSISSLQVKDTSGFPIEYINIQSTAKICFAGSDVYYKEIDWERKRFYQQILIDSTKLYIKKQSTGIWEEISWNVSYKDEEIGVWFESEDIYFSPYDRGYVGVKIHIADSAGNTTTLTVEPVFKVYGMYYVDIEEKSSTDKSFDLSFYPNPVNGEVQIEYMLKKEQYLQLEVINLQGQNIRTVYSGKQKKGHHSLHWNVPKGITPGLYYLVLKTEGEVITRKIVKL